MRGRCSCGKMACFQLLVCHFLNKPTAHSQLAMAVGIWRVIIIYCTPICFECLFYDLMAYEGNINPSPGFEHANRRVVVIIGNSNPISCVLCEYKEINTKKDHYEVLQWPYLWRVGVERGSVKRNQYREFSENETPGYYKLLITYSFNQDFSTYSTLYSKVYARYVIGFFSGWSTMNKHINTYNKEKAVQKIKGRVQEFVPDFWDNFYRLIGGISYADLPKKK